jgi:hypothetical protein
MTELKLPTYARFVNLTGKTFGRLSVVEFGGLIAYRCGRRRASWVCRCQCGVMKTIDGQSLLRGDTQSCGCYRDDRIRDVLVTHGHATRNAHSNTYAIWRGMIERCTNRRCKDFKKYGACGITVCERWHDFSNFLKDVGERPSKQHSIDRFPNMSGDYEPGNVRWATTSEQARNRKTNAMYTINGETRCLAEWVEIYGTSRSLVNNRLRIGWTIEKSLSVPSRGRRSAG